MSILERPRIETCASARPMTLLRFGQRDEPCSGMSRQTRRNIFVVVKVHGFLGRMQWPEKLTHGPSRG